MRIGIDIRSLLEPFPSGVSEYTYHIVRHLIQIDQENEYLLFCNSTRRKINNLYTGSLRGERVRLIQRHVPNKLFNSSLFFFRQPKIDRLLGGIDVMFLPNFNFLALSSDCRRVAAVHDLSFLQPGFYSIKGQWWHRFIRPHATVRQADRLIAVSESTKRDLVSLWGCDAEKISVIHSGVELERFQHISTEELHRVRGRYHLAERFILFIGTVEKRKNIEALLEAWRRCRLEYGLQMALVVAGTVRDVDLPRRFPGATFLGYVPDQDKPALYKLASVFAYPSVYEGFGLPVIEAMAAGTPVVTSFATSLPEVARDAAILVDPYNVNELAFSLHTVATDNLLRQALLRESAELVKNYTWDRAAKETLSVLLQAAKK